MIHNTNRDQFLIGCVDLIEVIYCDYDKETQENNFTISYNHFPVDKLDEAIDVYIERLNSDNPMFMIEKGYKAEDIHVYNTKEVYYRNHYSYLERILEYFWLEVFGKTPSETWNSGIISAHGDKCRGHESKWKEHGINFNRGSLLFLLTYTKEFGENDKCKSAEWVIENYQKYLPAIEKAEKLIFENLFNKK